MKGEQEIEGQPRERKKTSLFMAALLLHCCMGYSLVAACRLLMAVASLIAEHRLQGTQALVVAVLRL